MNLFRPEPETCPICKSHGNLHIHSYYRRNLIDFIDGKTVHHEITITRVRCNSCNSTHAILPDFIIPYCSYSLFFVMQVLGHYFMRPCSIEKICEKFSITIKQLYKWLNLWKLHKSRWLGFLNDIEMTPLMFFNYLSDMDSYSGFASSFVSRFGFSFLQSHRNPRTAFYCQHVFKPDYKIT